MESQISEEPTKTQEGEPQRETEQHERKEDGLSEATLSAEAPGDPSVEKEKGKSADKSTAAEPQKVEDDPRKIGSDKAEEPEVISLPGEVKCEVVKRSHGELDKIISVPTMSLVEKPKRKYIYI